MDTNEDIVPTSPLLVNTCKCIVTQFSDMKRRSQVLSANKKLICKGRPKPELYTSTDGKLLTSLYDDFEWLTSCPEDKKLYCWPCLIFERTSYNIWNVDSVKLFTLIRRVLKKHCTRISHLKAYIQFQQFMKRNDPPCRTQMPALQKRPIIITYTKDLIIQNRSFLSSIIDIVLYMIKQDIVRSDNFVQVSTLFSRHNIYLQKNIYLLHELVADQLLADIIETISRVILNELKMNINNSTKYISILLNATSVSDEIAPTHKLWTTVRYTDEKDDICEHLIDITDFRTLDLMQHIRTIQTNYPNKLISISHDIPLTHKLNVFTQQMNETEKSILFVPATCHSFFATLACAIFMQCTETRQFFQTIVELSHFFLSSNKLISIEVTGDIAAEPTDWTLTGHLFRKILLHRAQICSLFRKIIANTFIVKEDEWPNTNIYSTINTFLSTMDLFSFNIMLFIFANILPRAESLDDTIRASKYNIKRCIDAVTEFRTISAKRKQLFDAVWLYACDTTNGSVGRNKIETHKTFLKIHDIVQQELDQKYVGLNDLDGMDVLNPDKIPTLKNDIPNAIIENFIQRTSLNYGLAMHRELSVLYSDSDMFEIIQNQGCLGITKYLRENNLISCLTNVHNYFTKIITYPLWPAIPCAIQKSAIYKISEYQKRKNENKNKENGVSVLDSERTKNALAIINIENETLNQLIATSRFYEKCMDNLVNIKPEKYSDHFKLPPESNFFL